MDRRTRAFIVVGVAAVLALGAAFGVYRAIQTRPVVREPLIERFTVVASRSIPAGSMITNDMVKVAGWPANAPVAGGFSKPDEVVGRGVTVALVENEPIIETKLSPKGVGAGLSPLITPGMRAMALRVNDVVNVAGYVLPGTLVDVIVTLHPGQDTVSRVVIGNVKVLSVAQSTDTNQAREGKPAPGATVVTVELSPTDSERLALAMNQGQVTLALRNQMDVAKVDTPGARMAALLGAPAPEPIKTTVKGQTRMVTPPPPPPPPKPPTVEVIAGTQRREQIIKK